MNILIKSAAEPWDRRDGVRVMVDETLPSGMDEYKAHVDMWPREIGPSSRLREFLEKNPNKWDEFEGRYIKELDTDKDLWVNMLLRKSDRSHVVL